MQFLVLTALALTLLSLAGQQKPTVTTVVHVDNRSTATSIDDLWRVATIVAEGTIESETPVDIVSSTGESIAYTEYAFRISEVFKRDDQELAPGALLPVRHRGGTRDRGTHFERIVPDALPLLELNGRYILFLRKYVVDSNTFYSTGSLGPEGVFRVGATGLESPGRTAAAAALVRQGAARARSLLRQKGGGND
jgi:hypothetical protein